MEKTEVIERLAALAQETRLDILRFLVRRGVDGAAAGRIGRELGLASATLAFHLNTLTAAGLLIRRRDGRQNIYRADIGAVHALSAYLLENCCSESDVDDIATGGVNAA
jgi:DNA-binding transcriptional ArsR family regulator